MSSIRNFCIIAHIDHGKSTLADRLLELTGSIEKRKMQSQVLDTMELEREHGITIKLQPARMTYTRSKPQQSVYSLNLIDTPGHVDFSYEVSRSLAAVEGALMVVDASQGVQAQTLATLHMAQSHNLTIIPVINKIDLPAADTQKVINELNGLNIEFACAPILISAKTGENVTQVLDAVTKYVPPPRGSTSAPARALIFDSYFDSYRGVITYVRVIDGSISAGSSIRMIQAQKDTQALEVGAVCVGLRAQKSIENGQIGYIVTSLKDVASARVGDTITSTSEWSKEKGQVVALTGYREPQAMVYAGLFTASGEDYKNLREAIGKLKLNDASLQYEPATSMAFGFGFRAGFLGLLHLEIIKERLEREYNLDLVVTTPTVAYRKTEEGWLEPWVKAEIITGQDTLGAVMQLVTQKRGVLGDVDYLGDRVVLSCAMPLAEVIVEFYDRLKAVTSGYGSLSYVMGEYRSVDLLELDILVAEERVDALARKVPRQQVAGVARRIVEKLKEVVPRQAFEVKLQAVVGGKVLAAERIAPYRKDVTAKLYGGDVTRKRKLLEKQKKGKKKMAAMGRVEVPTEVFVKLLKY
ncbi:GTP-binding protein [Patescibacteria group bacterium]|nr:GTP-binding protein [Patescibacteria group bacterium]